MVGANKTVEDLQQDVEIVPAGENRFTATGTIFYNNWSEGWSTETANGYYIALGVYAPGSTVKIWNKADGNDNWADPSTGKSDGEVNWMIGKPDGTRASEIRIKAYEKIFTIDLSQLKFDTRLEVEAGEGEGETGKYYGRDVSAIQDIDVTVDETAKTVKVSGTAFYQDNWEAWSSDNSLKDGYFIALHFNVPGNGKVVVKNGLNEDAKTKDLNGNDLVLKVGDLNKNKLNPDRTFVIVKDNNYPERDVVQVYTLDLSDLEMVDPNGVSGISEFSMSDTFEPFGGIVYTDEVTEWVVE